MSSPATHIRFALDFKEKYGVRDTEQYIAGTVYPDSRYITKIDRKLTHNDGLLEPGFIRDDFRKGWQAHWICDLVGDRMQTENFPDLFRKTENGFSEENWIVSTAMKIIQDMNDRRQFPVRDYLKFLGRARNPNGEDIGGVRRHYRLIVRIYGKEEIAIKDYCDLMGAVGINGAYGARIEVRTKEFLRDAGLVRRIEGIYGDMIAAADRYFPVLS